MSDTPVSDLIGPALRAIDGQARVALHDALLDTWLGVHLARMPERGVPGERLELNAEDDVGFGCQAMPDGRKLIKVCADPEAFRRNYPQMAFQADVEGRELFKMILRGDYFAGALICSALAQDAYQIERPMIRKLLDLTPNQLAIRAAARERVVQAASAPRWHVSKAAAIGMVDYIVGLLAVALVTWGVSRLLALAGRTSSEFASGSNGASDRLASLMPLVTTVCGWIAVTIYAMVLTNRRAFEGFRGKAVWRLQQFILVFELLRIEFAPDVVEWFRRADAIVAGNGSPGWLLALAELPLHPYVLVGCVAVMPFLSTRVIARERRARERAKAAAPAA